MRTRITAWATNGLLVIDGVTVSPSSDLHDTGLIMVIPPHGVAIVTGVNMGPVLVDVEPRTSPPAAPDIENWEDVAEFTAGRAPVVPVKVHGEMELPSSDAPDLSPSDSAYLRVRVSVNGRDAFHDLAVTEPSEHYLVQAWPVEESGEGVWKSVTSATAKSQRAARPLSDSSGADAG